MTFVKVKGFMTLVYPYSHSCTCNLSVDDMQFELAHMHNYRIQGME